MESKEKHITCVMRKYRLYAASLLMLLSVIIGGCLSSGDGRGADNGLNEKGVEHVETAVGTASPNPATGTDTAADAVYEESTDIAAGDGERVKVNQVGYLTDQAKLAIVEGKLSGSASFSLIDRSSKKIVFTGTLGPSALDYASGQEVSSADFSAFASEGDYLLAVDGVGRSYPFVINDNPYDEALMTLVRSYALQSSGVSIEDPITGLKLEAGHLQDKEARIFFDDGVSRKGETIDVSGGWYDAGDFGKYINPAAVTVAQLMLAYELYPDAFAAGQLELPKGVTAVTANSTDLLDVVRYELEWMLKMQRADGAVYHKVSGAQWPGFIRPSEDTQTRYVFGLSTYGTAQFAGAMAMAARVYEPIDAEFAKRALEAAKLAQSYLDSNPNAMFRNDPGQDAGSGGYQKQGDAEERFWALAELYKTTGSSAYSEQLYERFAGQFSKAPASISWGNAGLLGAWAYYTAGKGDPDWKEQIRLAVTSRADMLALRSEQDGYRNMLIAGEYNWASAKSGAAYGCLLLLANEMKASSAYTEAAYEQLHNVLGRGATGYSYVTGVGSKYPLHSHHRTANATGVNIPGLVVGGPNQYGGDPDLDAVKSKLAPAMAYLDVLGSYSSNEYAIDYNAPVVMLTAYFVAKGN